jgi:hypothetical protein
MCPLTIRFIAIIHPAVSNHWGVFMTVEFEIDFAVIQMDLSPTKLGLAVAGNGNLAAQIRKGRQPRAPMIDRIRAYIADARHSRGLAPVAPDGLIPAMEAYIATRAVSTANRSQ